MGLAFTIDTPLKVARFGINSVVSIIDDQLPEDMRKYYCGLYDMNYTAISANTADYRVRRITAYLNLMHDIVSVQLKQLKAEKFTDDSEISKYFNLLPETSILKKQYKNMLLLPEGDERNIATDELRNAITGGAIDVNIMAKVDNNRYDDKGKPTEPIFSDALSALRGFAQSRLQSSVFSAGYNPRLFSYLTEFPCFYPDSTDYLSKKVTLKVSDYRSALIQGRILAKKGIWTSEFRIESGLNCGGHAFPTEGILMGPILEEFKEKRSALHAELFEICNKALADSQRPIFVNPPEQRISAQGGVGTAEEHDFLLNYYGLDSIGWGSPFLLVPEATCVDDDTLKQLATATKDDYYLSNASPLGVPFNNFRKSTSEAQRKTRIEQGRPGSPCYKKYLSSDTEFTDIPICMAARKYQHLKIKQLQEQHMPENTFDDAVAMITEKDCLCEGLSASALLKYNLPLHHKLSAITICPGPNLAYFSGVFSLNEMVGHIYGRTSLLNKIPRPHMLINELNQYVDYYHKHLNKTSAVTEKQRQSKERFLKNIEAGIEYYRGLFPELKNELDKTEQDAAEHN
jgi:hypothetical protein